MKLYQKILLKIASWFLPKGWVISTFEQINNKDKTAISSFTEECHVCSGIDIKLYMVPFGEKITQPLCSIKDKNGDQVYTKVGCVGSVSAIQLKDKVDHFGGTMTFIIFDDLKEVESLRGKKMQALLVSADEYGKVATLLDKPIVFNEYYNWSFSIDDMATEATIDFVVVEDKE